MVCWRAQGTQPFAFPGQDADPLPAFPPHSRRSCDVPRGPPVIPPPASPRSLTEEPYQSTPAIGVIPFISRVRVVSAGNKTVS